MYTLPEHWLNWLAANYKDGKLSAYDFDGSVVLLNFEDGSNARFNYAFYVLDSDRNELAVFTEHCGYHVYSTLGLNYRKVK